jgi:hypothetical protein
MVELDRKYNPQNSGTELDEGIIQSLPLPVSDAYRLLENQRDKEKALQVLCLSLIPWTFQYIALIFSGEYLSCEEEPEIEVTDSLLNMIKKPGPGKWLGFTRIAVKYFKTHNTKVIDPATISKLSKILVSKDQPFAKISGNENKLGYSDALINIRNRFAHSRVISAERTKEYFDDYFQIWKAWIILIKDIFQPRLIYRSAGIDSFLAFDNLPFEKESLPGDLNNETTVLWNSKGKTFIRLYPVIVTYAENIKVNAGVAFLEEIKSRYLFYLQGENFFKLKEEFSILSDMLESKAVAAEVLTAENLTMKAFGERIDRITDQTITSFTDSQKFIPEMYIDRPAISGKLDKWLESDKPGCIITGNPGTGKTSIISNWCLQRKFCGDHVLLLEASRLPTSDITMVIEQELNLGSSLKECLDTLQRQQASAGKEKISHKFIIVIDAINEFTGTENENRGRLWREINSLTSILDLYKPMLKCLVTTRSDLWNFDFPGKEAAFDILKEKLYWDDEANGFPRIIIGDLIFEEAEDIFEKARRAIPAMSVKSSFMELPEKTRLLLCNPFMLRLALLTFNEKQIPNLNKSKLEKQFAKSRLTEENDKKKVLFTLLERMAAIRKTEVTFDEFLYPKSKSKLLKFVSVSESSDLEKLIFDPRPKSPYKQLLADGILEERSDESNIKSKEKIRFSQEKITDIIYSEFQKRTYKTIKIVAILMTLIIIIGVAGTFINSASETKKEISDLKAKVIGHISDNEKSLEIIDYSGQIIKQKNRVTAFRESISLIFLNGLMLLFAISSPMVRFLGAKFIRNDLPSRFIKEKFNEIKLKKFRYGIIPIVLIIGFFLIKHENSNQKLEITESLIKYAIPVFLSYFALWDLILGVYIVITNANSANDAFCLFGKKEVFQSCINHLPLIPYMLILFFAFPYLLKLKDIGSDKKLVETRSEWNSNEAISSLRTQNTPLYSELRVQLVDPVRNEPSKSSPVIHYYFKILIYSMLIIYPITLLLQYYIGIWLFKFLKRKL